MLSPDEAKKAYEKHGSIRKAAKKLGVPRTTFRRILNKTSINKENDKSKKQEVNQSKKEFNKPSSLLTPNKNRKITTLVLSDIHAPYEDTESLRIAIEYARMNYSINKVIFLGDYLDCFMISRFSKNPRERMSFADELKYSSELMDQIIDIFNGCSFTFIKGNHERRFEKYLMDNAPELIGVSGSTIQEQLDLENKGVEYIDNVDKMEEEGEPYKIGELYYLHGDETGDGGSINIARNKFMKVQQNIIFGHYHQIQSHMQRCFNAVRGSWSVGCLCNTNPRYCPASQHLLGFAIVEHEQDGTFSVQNKMIIDGRVY